MLESQRFSLTLSRSGHIASHREATEWVTSALHCDPDFACRLAMDLMTEVRSSAPPYSYRELPAIPDSEIYDLPTLVSAVSVGLRNISNNDDVRDLTNFVNKLQKHLAGTADG